MNQNLTVVASREVHIEQKILGFSLRTQTLPLQGVGFHSCALYGDTSNYEGVYLKAGSEFWLITRADCDQYQRLCEYLATRYSLRCDSVIGLDLL